MPPRAVSDASMGGQGLRGSGAAYPVLLQAVHAAAAQHGGRVDDVGVVAVVQLALEGRGERKKGGTSR